MPQEQQSEYAFSTRQKILGLTAIFAVYGTLSFFVQTFTVARPKIVASLNGMDLYAQAASIPALAGAFITLIFGKFSDIYGRRIMLLISVILVTAGAILAAVSQTIHFLIAASVISSLGTGAMMPLVFAVVGDLFPPEKRGTWIGLLNIPTGVFAVIGPLLGGWWIDHYSWRYLYLMALPLLIVCLVTVPAGVPSVISKGVKTKIDVSGIILVILASSSTIIGLTNIGKYPWMSTQVGGLLAIAVVLWIFFLYAESRAEAPIVEPSMLRNRVFMTVSGATLLSFFAQMMILMYFPIFLQGILNMSGTISGRVITPFSLLMSFVGVPVGFLLGFSKKFKWMYVVGYGLLTVDLFGMIFFSSHTTTAMAAIAAAIAGISLGAAPTVNTIVIQNGVPKRLLGVAMGAFFFSLSIGVAIAPAVLGAAMDGGYAKKLAISLPAELTRVADKETIASLTKSDVLLNKDAMERLHGKLEKMNAGHLFAPTVQAIRASLETGLRCVFWVGAIAVLLAFLLISTVPAKLKDASQD
jgi:MFS family permease